MSESRIPDFNNREEEAEIFVTHDFTEFWQEGTPVKPRRTYSEARGGSDPGIPGTGTDPP